MSLDGKEPGWHSSGDLNWDQSLEHAHQSEYDELPPQSALEDEEALPLLEEPDFAQDEGYEDGQAGAGPASTPLRLLRQFGQSIALIITPLIFGVLTCLFVLPLIASGRAYIPPAGLWPVIIAIIVVALAQAVGVYYAGADNKLWILATIGGFFLFLLVGCFAIFGPIWTLVLLVVLFVISVVLVRLYFRTVAEGYVDIVYSFGKYSRTLYPGFNILMPWEKVMSSLNVGEKQWACPLQKVQLSRDEDVVLRATISYQLSPDDAHIAAQVDQWENRLKEHVLDSIQSIARKFSPDDFFAWPQGLHSRPLTYDDSDSTLPLDRFNAELLQSIKERAANWGVQVNWVRILDVSLAPHGATIVEADSIVDMPTMVIDPAPSPAPQPAKAPVSAPAQSSQPKAAAGKQKNGSGNARLAEEPTQIVPVPVPASPPVASSPPPPDLPNEKVLIEAYETVQNRRVTDPDTIRSIAAKFEQVARDPAYRDKVSFDAERAAQNLYAQARKNEELINTGQLHSDKTRPDLDMRHPDDDLL